MCHHFSASTSSTMYNHFLTSFRQVFRIKGAWYISCIWQSQKDLSRLPFLIASLWRSIFRDPFSALRVKTKSRHLLRKAYFCNLISFLLLCQRLDNDCSLSVGITTCFLTVSTLVTFISLGVSENPILCLYLVHWLYFVFLFQFYFFLLSIFPRSMSTLSQVFLHHSCIVLLSVTVCPELLASSSILLCRYHLKPLHLVSLVTN